MINFILNNCTDVTIIDFSQSCIVYKCRGSALFFGKTKRFLEQSKKNIYILYISVISAFDKKFDKSEGKVIKQRLIPETRLN